jgi:hypothetical protein
MKQQSSEAQDQNKLDVKAEKTMETQLKNMPAFI